MAQNLQASPLHHVRVQVLNCAPRWERVTGSIVLSSLFTVPVECDAVVPEQLTSLALWQAAGLFEVLALFENSEVVAALKEKSDWYPP